ncbi:MAG TPA: M28 family peptidase [Beutenbergiaceae bacterium]|nr:M28 family peptidase [Beutenbergiaceae bacterium]
MGKEASSPAPASSPERRRTAWLPVAGLAVLAAVSLWTVADLSPPPARDATAPAQEFSAERARRHIEVLAAQPRVMGTPEHARAREYLVGELRALGAQVEVHEAVGFAPWPENVRTTGNVHNIVAVFPGNDPTGQVVLAAHYDSVPASPGANDDAAGVAVTLEVARALSMRPVPVRNDLVVLLTDGEEVGLVGAEAFVHSHPRGAQGGVVLNHEARGGSGAAMMFRTNSGALVRSLGRAGPAAVADSAIADAFALLPNDTDFVAFEGGGFLGMDFAYAGSSAYYHSALDMPQNVSARSVQHMGANTLALAADLGGQDLHQVDAGVEVAYANVPPGLLLIIPHGALQALGAFGVLLAAAAVWRARRRGLTSLPRVALGAGATVVLIMAAVGAAWAYGRLVSMARPGFTDLLTQTPYEPVAFQAGMVALVLLVALGWWRLTRGWVGGGGLVLGAVAFVVVLGAGTAAVAPGSAVAFVVPGLTAAAVALRADGGRTARDVALTVLGLVPAAMLVLPAAWVSFEAGFSLSPVVVAPFAALGFALALPLLEMLGGQPPASAAHISPGRSPGADAPRSPSLAAGTQRPAGQGAGTQRPSSSVPARLTVAVVSLGVVAATAIGIARNPLDSSQPVPVHLSYTLDPGAGQANWAVPASNRPGGLPHPWVAEFADQQRPDPTPGRSGQAHIGAAEPAGLAPPRVELTAEQTGAEHRVLNLTVSSPRGAPLIHLGLPGRAVALTLNDREVPDPAATVEFHGLPPGQELHVELHVQGTDPVEVTVADITETADDVAQLPGFPGPPAEVFLGDVRVAVTSTHDF